MIDFLPKRDRHKAWFGWINLFWREVLVSFVRCFEMMAFLGVIIVSHRLHSLCKEVVAGKGAFELPSLGITLPIWRWIVIIVNIWVEHHYHHSWLQKVTHHCKHPKEKKNWQTLDKGKKALSSFFVNEFPYLFFFTLFSNLRQKTHFLDKRKCHLNTRSSTK